MSSANRIRVWSVVALSAAMVVGAIMLSGRIDRDDAQAAEPSAPGGSPTSRPVAATDATFGRITAKGVVLVDFQAAWCGYCREQKPIVEQIAADYAGRVTVVEVDVDTNPKTAREYEVEGLPTLVVFKDGKVINRLVGLQSEAALRSALDAALE